MEEDCLLKGSKILGHGVLSTAKVKIDSYSNAYANDSDHNHDISFMPAVTSTSSNVHCKLLCILFLHISLSRTKDATVEIF